MCSATPRFSYRCPKCAVPVVPRVLVVVYGGASVRVRALGTGILGGYLEGYTGVLPTHCPRA